MHGYYHGIYHPLKDWCVKWFVKIIKSYSRKFISKNMLLVYLSKHVEAYFSINNWASKMSLFQGCTVQLATFVLYLLQHFHCKTILHSVKISAFKVKTVKYICFSSSGGCFTIKRYINLLCYVMLSHKIVAHSFCINSIPTWDTEVWSPYVRVDLRRVILNEVIIVEITILMASTFLKESGTYADDLRIHS